MKSRQKSPGARVSRCGRGGKAAASRGRDQCLRGAHGGGDGVSRAVSLGGGVAANSLGMPDLGISTMEDVLTDVRRITEVTTLPLLVDIDTGWGSAFNIARTIRSMIKAGAARCTWKTRWARSGADIGREKSWCLRTRWWTESKLRWMRARMKIS